MVAGRLPATFLVLGGCLCRRYRPRIAVYRPFRPSRRDQRDAVLRRDGTPSPLAAVVLLVRPIGRSAQNPALTTDRSAAISGGHWS